MNLFGLVMETANVNKAPDDIMWEAFWFGCFAGIVPWVLIIATCATTPGVSNYPGWMFLILGLTALMFIVIGTHMWLKFKQMGWWKDSWWGYPNGGYLFGEKVYLLCSVVAKSSECLAAVAA